MTAEEKVKRQEYIIENLSSGKKSMGELGRELGITRERVSQIFYQGTGSAQRGLLLQNRRSRYQQLREAKLDRVKFVCIGCGKSVTYREGKYKKIYCRDCHKQSQSGRAMRVNLQCTNCGKTYHPFLNSKYQQKRDIGLFCSKRCYNRYPVRKGGNFGKNESTRISGSNSEEKQINR